MAPCDEQMTKGREAACLRGETLDETGRQFSVAKYSGVGSAIKKMKKDVSTEGKLRVRVKHIEKIHNSQQQI